nr:hypothetical protein [Blastocatellia bacterium]
MSAESVKAKPTEFTNPNLEVLYSEQQIRERIREIGDQITTDHRGRE